MPVTPIRLVAVDLDDCLFNRDGDIPDESLTALDDLAGQGIQWCVATGRALGRLTDARERLHPTAGWIYAYGAGARYFPEDGQMPWGRMATLGKLELLAVADLLTAQFPDAVMGVDAGEVLYCDEGYPKPPWPGRQYRVVERENMMPGYGDMIRIHCPRAMDIADAICQQNLPVRVWDQGFTDYIEITHSTASKLIAFAMLATHLGVKDCEIAAIGDGHSDAGMLKWAKLGVSFTDAHPTAQTDADVLVDIGKHDDRNRFVEALKVITDHSSTCEHGNLY